MNYRSTYLSIAAVVGACNFYPAYMYGLSELTHRAPTAFCYAAWESVSVGLTWPLVCTLGHEFRDDRNNAPWFKNFYRPQKASKNE